MRKLFLVSIFISSILVSQNNDNVNNRSQNTTKDSLMTNTYHLENNKDQLEPVSPTNMFQDPDDESTTWRDYKRDLNGNIIYDQEPGNNGKVRWQNAAYWTSREKQGMWNVAKLPYVSEDDVLWGTRVTRTIVLDNPSNISLKMPIKVTYDNHFRNDKDPHSAQEVFSGIDARKNLFQILFDAAVSGQVNVYNSRLSRQYSEDEIIGNVEEKKEGCFSYLTYDTEEEEGDFNEEFWDPSADEEEYVQILDTFKAFEIIKYIIVEDWFFDKRRSKMDVRIISITPVCTYEFGLLVDGEIETEAVDEKELGTFFYPEIRNLLANHKIYNSQIELPVDLDTCTPHTHTSGITT